MSVVFQDSSSLLVHTGCICNREFQRNVSVSPIRKRTGDGIFPAEYICKGCGMVFVQMVSGAPLRKESE